MYKKKLMPLVAVILMFGSMFAVAPAVADHPQQNVGDHCPGANPGAPVVPDGMEIDLDNDTTEAFSQTERNNYVPEEGDILCIKTGQGDTQATGIFMADDSGKNLREWLFHFGHVDGSGDQGRNVSYYMTYSSNGDVTPVVDVSPILECVATVDDDYVAYFGYLNHEETTVTIPIGEENKFTPGPEDRGQPTVFEPGRTDFVDDAGEFKPENAAVAVPFDGSNLVWTLDGRTSTASSTSTPCPVPAEDPTGEVTVLKAWNLGTGTDGRDDLGNLDATLKVKKTLDGDDSTKKVPHGHTFTDLQMGTLVEVIGEKVTGLPSDCRYIHDGFSGVAWTVSESAPVGTITLTNTVTCDVPITTGEVTVLKAWNLGTGTDGREDLGDLDATLEVRKDGVVLQGGIESGHTFTDLQMGTLVEVVGENVTGLPSDCRYTHDGFSGIAWTVTESAPVGTITLTNTVTCDEEPTNGEVIDDDDDRQPRQIEDDGDVLGAVAQVDAPVGAVLAGGGGAASSSLSAFFGLLASLGLVGAGFLTRKWTV